MTGVLVASDSPEALAAGIRRALDLPFDAAAIRRHAERFGPARFDAEFRAAIDDVMSAPADEAAW